MTTAMFDDLQRLLSQMHAQEALDRRLKADGQHPNALDARRRRQDGAVFVSDWNGEHPFAGQFLGGFTSRTVGSLGAINRYSHLEEDPLLQEKVQRLHAVRYKEPARPSACFLIGAGAASFLATMLFRVRQLGFDRLCYLPPVYNSAVYLIREMGFAVHKAAEDVDFATEVPLSLPDVRCALWLTDPVWFAGRRVRAATIEEIAGWQRRTGSLVVVDGTFQYMQWDEDRRERSSQLDPRLTYRLVCPTKSLALHGFRFAYLLMPEEEAAEITELHSRLHGAAGVADRAFAHHAVEALASDAGNAPLMRYAQQRFDALREAAAVTAWVEPECGNFLFARPAAPLQTMHGMGPDCFEVRGRHGHVRINLLNDRAFEHLCSWGRRRRPSARQEAGSGRLAPSP